MLVAVSYHLKGLATLVDDTAVWDPGNDERNEERYDLFRYDVRLHGFLVPECICAILFRTTTGHDVSPEELRTIQENVHYPAARDAHYCRLRREKCSTNVLQTQQSASVSNRR